MLDYTLGTLEASEALIKDLYIDLRSKVNAWSEITQQTPQARMGYIGQHLVSVVTGFPGGKSGARGYDLVMNNGAYGEIKTCYRVDQLGSCINCGAVVSSLETQCSACGSTKINRKNDSKWLIGLRNKTEFAEVIEPLKYYFVLFEFSELNNPANNDIEATIWEVASLNKGFVYCMVDYYLNIRAKSESKAPFNMWPHDFKFSLTKPVLIYKSIIKSDGTIQTLVFPTMNNTYPDPLKPLTEYRQARTLTVDVLHKVIFGLTHRKAIGLSKKGMLELLEKIRVGKGVSNEILCDLFAEKIYLPRILPKKNEIPPEITRRFPELA